MKKNREEIVAYINALNGYEGYIQYSHRAIDFDKDVFAKDDTIAVETEKGFVYEAHFFNGTQSIKVRQFNNEWCVDVTDNVPMTDVDTVDALSNFKVKMAQVWESKADKYCKDMQVQTLDKVVFAGFEKGASND